MPLSTRELFLLCWPLALIFGVGVLVVSTAEYMNVSVTGKPMRDLALIIGAAELAAYLWIRVFAHFPVRKQLTVGAVVIALQAGVYLSLRLDGFTGDARPRISWRWTATPEEKFAASRHSANEPPISTVTSANFESDSPSDYPSFRGRDRSAVVRGVTLSSDWQTRPPKQLWRQPIGRGWSSFAVLGEYCVTQEQRSEFEVVVCYEVRTGREVWVHRDRACFDEVTGGKGPRATPTIEQKRVFSLGATGILNCLDASTGKRIWSVNILKTNHVENRLFGMAGSPLVLDGMVVVSPGGRGVSLVAYDQRSGRQVWAAGDADASYSSVQFAPLACGDQILSFNAEGLFSHAVASGSVLWSYPWVSNPTERNNVCQPVPFPANPTGRGDQVFVSSGYGKGSALLEITENEGLLKVHTRWSNRNLKSKFSSVVVHDGFVYGFDNAILACIELETGQRKWKRGRYGHGQLILVGDRLLIQAESGEVVLVDASPSAHRERTRFAALSDRTWNHPVLSRNLLLVRNDREAACYELPLE